MASVVTSVITKSVTKTALCETAFATSSHRASPQGGVLEGGNPSVYNTSNPIILFRIQSKRGSYPKI
ncbi:hypothetical protein G7Y89_g4812 [Cudoniella acicularis]|uniref:Uncharacterized protein n=1 Tax=Cudoniella acicularis TaxID=354080 RepID=A0A8H4RPH6_9HELO|nr:hypothetical protein G7Y89_g4812 [Cudoniella acicularis]